VAGKKSSIKSELKSQDFELDTIGTEF